MFTKSISITLLILSIFFITSCDSKNETKDSSEESTKITKKEYKYEDLNDPVYYKHERLQFVWRPKNEKLDSVWTIKLDGTDLRRVIDPKKMLYDGAKDLSRQVPRSPDRRYLAYSNWILGKVDRNIIDLKTGEIIKLGTDSIGSKFIWSTDGKLLFFDLNSNDYVYDMEKMKSTKLKGEFYIKHISALNKGKLIVGFYKSGVAYYNYEGELLKEYEIEYMKNHKAGTGGNKLITSNGRFILHIHKNKYRLYEMGNKLSLIKLHEIPKFIQSHIAVMHDDANYVFMAANWGVMRYDLSTDDYTKIYDGDGSRIGVFSILY